MSITQEMLLDALADGRFHSGVELGEMWGISRAAVSQLVRKFALPGLEIYRVRGKGYRLKERLYFLNQQEIMGQLTPQNQAKVAELRIFKVIPSTNSYLLDLVDQALQNDDDRYRVCFSEMQTAGRGTRGRKWVSPPGHNIYLSLLKTFDAAPPGLSGLSIVVGLALIRVLHQHGVSGLGFKWPNDIYVNSRKVAGILLETRSQAFGITSVVIGVGINLKVDSVVMADVDQPWSAVVEHGFDVSRRNEFAGDLVQQLIQLIEEFRDKGLGYYNCELEQFDLVKGCRVELLSGQKRISGVGCGIDSSGRLILQTECGLQVFSSGEVTMHGATAAGVMNHDS